MDPPPSSSSSPLWRQARAPAYNFVNTRPKTTTSHPHQTRYKLPPPMLDDIVAAIVEGWALRLDDSDSTTPMKVRKLWQSLVRQAQAGRQVRDVVGQSMPPNPVCTAIYVQILAEVLKMVLPPQSIGEMLLGGVVNSIYRNYDSRQAYYGQEMYSTDSTEQHVSIEQQTVRNIYTLYSRLDTSTQNTVAVDLVKPLLTVDVMSDLWDTLLALAPRRDHSQVPAHMKLFQRCFASLPRDEKREILPLLAESIQRRLDEFLPPVVATADDTEVGDTLQPLVETLSPGRSRQRSIVAVRGSVLLTKATAAAVNNAKAHLVRKPTGLTKRGSYTRRASRLSTADVVVSPGALTAILPNVVAGSTRRATQALLARPPPLVPHPSVEPDTSAELLEFVDELADDLKDAFVQLQSGEFRSRQSGMQDLERILTLKLGVALETEAAEIPVSGGTAMMLEKDAVATILQMLKMHPSALGSTMKQVPELLVDTLQSQQGVLKYAMVHCPHVVRSFLKLDAAAAEAWATLANAHAKGLTLLWSTDKVEADEVVVSPLEAAYQWLNGHVQDTAKVLLLNHDMAKQVFGVMESETVKAKASAAHRLKALVTELMELPTFQTFLQQATHKGFEMAMKHDVKGMVHLLTMILSNHGQLKELVGNSVEITAALALHNKQALLNLLSSDVGTWKPFFVELMVQNEFLLIDSLISKTKNLPSGAQLLAAFHSVLDGAVGHWVTEDESQAAPAAFKARSHFARALSVLRLTQNHPQPMPSEKILAMEAVASAAVTMSPRKGSTVKRGSVKKAVRKATVKHRISISPGVYHTPWIWKTFLTDATVDRPSASTSHPWGRRELKRFILDILIEKIKQDEIEPDEEVVSDLSVFVCDYLMTKLQNRSLVCFQLQQLVNGIQRHIEDPRVSFFASACGVKQLLRRGVLHSSLRSLSHLLFGVLKIFRPEKRLQELVDGSCVVPEAAVAEAARNVFVQCLSEVEMSTLIDRIAKLRHFPASDIAHELSHVDLDDAMNVYLQQWQHIESQMDEQFIHAFNRYRGANQEYVGIDQFVKIITGVTRNGVSVRDCRLIFYDTGKEMIDLNTLLHLTQEYDLRISLSHPPVLLDGDDFSILRRARGVSSVLSFEDEFKQLVACWEEIKPVIDKQVASVHQTEAAKKDLAFHRQAVEDSLSYLRSGIETTSMHSAWETFRNSIASLQSAVNAERSFSILYVQCHVRKWVSKLKRRQSERKKSTEQQTPAPPSRGGPSHARAPPHHQAFVLR
ncbi:Aste57867_20247 [Aphanomyces stellatus]|uniref:Aste57867_20247 protein n=1 Tax=Aphanomyces stellatus TaxID=120398 RepID=A0A485LEP4_9STRA|nr:hypothetical protein As57867_020181 [Aphanomyces stellatus]VFT96937.1 Aste57867_20247 [Aphanomyces stellatus]